MNKLQRLTFETSRLLEFFTKEELSMQIGHDVGKWRTALIKELVDNSLDACEIAEVAPRIEIEITPEYFSVTDNGPGIPQETIERSLDYLVRVSDKTFYVSPTRGQLGNALKCVYASPFVITGEHGLVTIEAGDSVYTIDVTLDRLAQRPELNLTCENGHSRDGTKLIVSWPESASLLESAYWQIFTEDFLGLVSKYAMFNPHTSFVLNGEHVFEATDPEWNKWHPNSPPSPHWYTSEQLRDLVTAYLVSDRDNGRDQRTIRDFLEVFRGLAGTQKRMAVTKDADLHGKLLADLMVDGEVSLGQIECLLAAMKEHSKPVKPYLLGKIGKDHVTTRMVRDFHVQPESIHYKCIASTDDDGLPHVVETAFGVFDEVHDDNEFAGLCGLNWSPTLGSPMATYDAAVKTLRIDRHDPVCLVVHVARPHFEFISRGKGRIDA